MNARQQPVYEIVQPDGTSLTVDFTTPGSFGDFAFTVRYPDGRNARFGAYHTAEASIFIDVLRCWSVTRTPGGIVAALAAVRAELAALTDGMEPSVQSENNFDHYQLDEIRVIATTPGDRDRPAI